MIIFFRFDIILCRYLLIMLSHSLKSLGLSNSGKFLFLRWQLDLIVGKTSRFPTIAPSSNDARVNGSTERNPAIVGATSAPPLAVWWRATAAPTGRSYLSGVLEHPSTTVHKGKRSTGCRHVAQGSVFQVSPSHGSFS
jgi:hypothetical protein